MDPRCSVVRRWASSIDLVVSSPPGDGFLDRGYGVECVHGIREGGCLAFAEVFRGSRSRKRGRSRRDCIVSDRGGDAEIITADV